MADKKMGVKGKKVMANESVTGYTLSVKKMKPAL
jgi:hypothetical protein